MSLQSVKSQIGALQKRLDAMDGAGDAVHYLWSAINLDGKKEIMAGNRHSRAKQIVEICVDERDGAESAPRFIIDGVLQNTEGLAAPGFTIEEVMHHA